LRTLITLLPAIGCLAMMLVMWRPMMVKRNKDQSAADQPDDRPGLESQEMAQLREEVAVLKAKLALQEENGAERPT
jgi:hypothetical protein